MIIALPSFEDILKVARFSEEEKYEASYEYTKILTDSQVKSESFTGVFTQVRKLCLEHYKNSTETILNYANYICDILYDKNCIIEPLYNRLYICVLVVSILINEGRRSL